MTNDRLPRIPGEFRAAAEMLSGELRALMLDEIDAGNIMIDAGHTHPAPPAGAYVMFANPISTRKRESFADVVFRDRNGASCSGEFADANRFFFVLEAAHRDDSYPDMDAIRERVSRQDVTEASIRSVAFVSPVEHNDVRSALERFYRSRELDYERWKEGSSYDLDALASLPPEEQDRVALSLIPAGDWRDVEALALIGTERTNRALRTVMTTESVKLRMAVLRFAPELVNEETKLETVLFALERAEPFEGLVETLDLLETFHPPVVVDAMFRHTLDRSGDIAYAVATTLAVIHGALTSRYDWSLRPQLLRFNTTDRRARETAFLALYDMLATSHNLKSGEASRLALQIRGNHG